MTNIPKFSGKVSLANLDEVSKAEWAGVPAQDSCVYHHDEDGLRYDFLWRPAPGSDKIFILFSGDAMRKDNDPPVFQRWSWAPHFPGHCLYFSDPSLYLNEKMGLAWYAGTEKIDVQAVIVEIIRGFLAKLGLNEENVYGYGSSGGGFATLRLLHFMPKAAAIAINPQTSVCRYEYKNVERYLDVCFNGRSREEALRDFPERLDLTSTPERLRGKRVAIIQNLLDTHHYEEHFKPLCAKLGTGFEHDPQDPALRRILFSHEGGHKKAETQEAFDAIIDQVRSGAF